MANLVHTAITITSVPLVVAASQWTASDIGVLTDLVPTTVTIRTGDANTIRSAKILPTMVMVVPMPTTTRSAPQVVAVSQWTVLELGVVTVHVSMCSL